MNNSSALTFQTRRWPTLWLALCAVLLVVVVGETGVMAQKKLSEKEARRLIAALPGVELKTSAVRIKNISPPGATATAEVTAGIKTAFRFRKNDRGGWVVAEVRVGDRQWEDVELLAAALRAQSRATVLADLETLAAELEAEQRRKAAEKGASENERSVSEKPYGATDEKAGEGQGKSDEREETGGDELRRGAVAAKNFSALISSATVEAEVETAFRFNLDARRKWRVAEIKIGDGEWLDYESIVAAVNAEKSRRAGAELETVAAALRDFRRERGFYVVADDHAALVDSLSPRHLTRVIRIDPWHRPYKYEGTRDGFALRSDGADGKPSTPDDVVVSK